MASILHVRYETKCFALFFFVFAICLFEGAGAGQRIVIMAALTSQDPLLTTTPGADLLFARISSWCDD
jgi:hypothetical protein